MTVQICQRWRERRDSYRPAGEVIDPRRYEVDLVPEADAKAFVVCHHYSGSFPAARCRVGLFRRGELVGVAVYSVPPSQAVIPKWTGLPSADGVELGRLVLLDDVPANGESWFVSRAMRVLQVALPDVRAVMSCSDPLRRHSVDGAVVMPGHVGTVYQALNARHVGRTNRSTIYLDPAGRVVSARATSKLRTGDSGVAGVEAALLDAGAPRRRDEESGGDWLARLRDTGWLRRARHPGCHVYLWALGPRATQRQTRTGWTAQVAYPKAPLPLG